MRLICLTTLTTRVSYTKNRLRRTTSKILHFIIIFTSFKHFPGVFQFIPPILFNSLSNLCYFSVYRRVLLLRRMFSGHVLGRNSALYRAARNCKHTIQAAFTGTNKPLRMKGRHVMC